MSNEPVLTDTTIESLLNHMSTNLAHILNRALEGKDIEPDDALILYDTSGQEFQIMMLVADKLRYRTVGDTVTYVVNRNINFTNVCIKRCAFCAFSRDHRQEEGYFLPLNEILRRVREARSMGASEICIQAGLPPKMDGRLYINLCESIKAEVPDIHIHGFSPEEILYGSVRSQTSIKDYLTALKEAGVGSLPGTAAEILDDRIRDQISPGRISTQQWIEVITTAHHLGIPTTSTIMYGHIETNQDIVRHIALIRDLQRATGGITEFVPLSFVHTESPMYKYKTIENIRSGPSGFEVMKMHAISRIMLNNWIPNIQVSWVKEGQRFGQVLMLAGVNDLGGTLINESISTSAGATFGQLVRPSEFRMMIRNAGRIPAERTTTYQLRKIFSDPVDDPVDPLDSVGENPDQLFGSYSELIQLEDFRYNHPSHPKTNKQ